MAKATSPPLGQPTSSDLAVQESKGSLALRQDIPDQPAQLQSSVGLNKATGAKASCATPPLPILLSSLSHRYCSQEHLPINFLHARGQFSLFPRDPDLRQLAPGWVKEADTTWDSGASLPTGRLVTTSPPPITGAGGVLMPLACWEEVNLLTLSHGVNWNGKKMHWGHNISGF